MDLQTLCNKQILNLHKYFHSKQNSPLHVAAIRSDLKYTPLNLSNNNPPEIPITTIINRQETWRQKSLRGRFAKALSVDHDEQKASMHWLRGSDMCHNNIYNK